MIRRLLARFLGPSSNIRQAAQELIAIHAAEGAWEAAQDKRRLAEVVDAEDESRHWSAVMIEIERQTGYQPNTGAQAFEP